jgi:hypothetical protein
MGSDIHGGFIKITKDENNVVSKQPIQTTWGMDRNYLLFAILAGVRNGYGFAGSYRHEPLSPIAEGRGLPDFITVKDECTSDLHNSSYGTAWSGEDETEFGEWLGDHSHTYMTVKEILYWDGWDKPLVVGANTGEDMLRESYKWFLLEIKRINDEFGEDVYLVIGFDS